MLASLTSVDDLLAATEWHPFVRSSLRYRWVEVRGWSSDGAVVWVAGDERPERTDRSTVGFGPAEQVADLLGRVAHLLPDGGQLTLPRQVVAHLPSQIWLARQVRWNFRWMSTPPPDTLGEVRVEVLGPDAHPTAAALLDRANPTASVRPGSGSARWWVGVRDGADRWVAVAADTSHRGVGHTSAVGTDPDTRGRGHGAAVTANLARAQVAEFGLATLGFYADNAPARRLYDRLGYQHELAISSGPRG